MKYLKYSNDKPHIIIQTMIFGIPQVVQFIVGVFPIFLGFAFLGIGLFCEKVI